MSGSSIPSMQMNCVCLCSYMVKFTKYFPVISTFIVNSYIDFLEIDAGDFPMTRKALNFH